MKLLATIGVLALLGSCSRDRDLVQQTSNSFMAKKPVAEFPVNNFGYIKGTLYPTPAAATIKVYNAEGYSSGFEVQKDGGFFIDNIPAGVYQLQINYLVQRAEFSYWAVLDMDRVVVSEKEVTELGVVALPWTF
jgi:hypothetical protein